MLDAFEMVVHTCNKWCVPV